MATITRSEFLALSEREKRIFLRSGTVTVDPPREPARIELPEGALTRADWMKLSPDARRDHVKSGKGVF
nr:hypothetical protein [uncultured Rhodopila sp.]